MFGCGGFGPPWQKIWMQIENMLLPRKNGLWRKQAQKDTSYYDDLKERYEEFTRGNEFLKISKAIDAVKTRNISLLTTDIGTLRLIGVSRETIEEVLKSKNRTQDSGKAV